MAKLTPRQQDIKRLLDENPEMKAKEIGERLGLKSSTVYSQLSKIRSGGKPKRRRTVVRAVEATTAQRLAAEISGEIAAREAELERLHGAHRALVA